uniref:plant cystathionine gamma-synthase n=1 Tax=Vitrella brassicaformis TaxID=1169539 RepID=A0A7S1K7W8_9ALVE|mmetsp:Transcript_4200/g.9584  ORF Transcript_4200/g.9584 Transcript_4200/m.9584 type:complete len:414 (+) Transcript_4200:73-1314(+)
MDSEGSFATKSIHAGSKPRVNHSMVCPIFQSATYEQPSLDQRYEDIKYLRLNNSPTHEHLDAKIGQLENGTALVLSSGMAAITTSLLALCSSGDHILMQDPCYGASTVFATHDLTRFGMDVTFFNSFDVQSIDEVLSLLRPSTRVIYVESIANPLTRIPNMPVIIEAAKLFGERHGTRIITMIDNTFATPYLQSPLQWGIDVVIHSSTKYLGGHSDVVGGVLVTNDKAIKERSDFYRLAMGLNPSPFDCWLVSRSIKTLAARMDRHSATGQSLAEYLSKHPRVSRVHFPGLPSHPDHNVAVRQMPRGYSGMVSAEFNLSLEETKRLISSFKVITLAESLGGVESLVDHPASMTHASIPAEERRAMGLNDGLVRFSFGLEDAHDLMTDIEEALAKVLAARETSKDHTATDDKVC